jgi:hypothetical protein
MSVKFAFACFVIACLLAVTILPAGMCQVDGSSVDVSFNVSYGGLLWVNGTNVINGTTLNYANASVLVLAATPTNANYSYANMTLNGAAVFDNPGSFVLVNPGLDVGGEWNVSSDFFVVSNQTVSVAFVAEAVPTPSPTPEVTADDAVGLAVVALIFAVCLPLALIIGLKGTKKTGAV